jgi:predicted DNA-binding transcriptional regulator AlpA
LTKFQVAALLQIKWQTLHHWVREGRFPAPVQLSRVVRRWRRADIDNHIAQLAAARGVTS